MFLAPVLAIVALFAPYARPQTVIKQLAPGVELVQERIAASEPGGPQIITMLRVDPKQPGVRIEAALGGDLVWGDDPTLGREIVSKTVARRGAVAGINASFFPFAGNPINLHIENGQVVTEPSQPRTAFLWMNDRTARFATFGFTGSVSAGEKQLTLSGLNRKPGKGNELLLFSPIFQNKTLKTPERVEVVLDGAPAALKASGEFSGKVLSVGVGGETPLAPGTVVLSGGGTAGAWLTANATVGAPLSVKLAVGALDAPGLDVGAIQQAVTGSPRIVTAGKVVLNLKGEKVAESFSTTRHPRTAIGVTAEGILLLVTVDGRQTGLSRGMSLTELGEFLIARGVVDAVNLDGGGSSACSVRGAVINSPSEGSERPVADCLLVFSGTTGPAPLTLVGPTKPLAVGETFPFALPEGADSAQCVWAATGGIGFVDQSGLFRALRPGKGTVRLMRGTEQISVALEVQKVGAAVSELDSADFTVKATLLPDSKLPNVSVLSAVIANAEGDRLGGEPVQLTINGGTASINNLTTSPRGELTLSITWDTATTPSTRSVKLSSPKKRFLTATLTPK